MMGKIHSLFKDVADLKAEKEARKERGEAGNAKLEEEKYSFEEIIKANQRNKKRLDIERKNRNRRLAFRSKKKK